MKILFTIGSLAGGGAERVVARLSNKLNELGCEIYVAMIANDKVEYDVSKDVKTKYINPSVNIIGLRMLSRMRNFKKFVKETNPDIVISFTTAVNVFVLQALKGLDIKIIVSERNNPYVDPADERQRNKRDKTYKNANGFVFQTEDARDYFTEEIRQKGTIILNPIDESLPSPHIGEREKRIVTVGRLEKQKNQLLLIDAFSKIADKFPEYVLEIYGAGSLEAILKDRIEQLGLEDRILLMGHCQEVIKRMVASSMFVLSSDYEGISNALLEAMAVGLPVVSTDHPIGGAKLLIKDGENGILVPVRDPDALSDAMSRVLSDSKLAAMLGKNARNILYDTSIDTISQRWLDFIERILE